MIEIVAPLEASYSSLCLLSYERPDFLKNTLDSLRRNTPRDYELIIHDDGSEDEGTRALVCNQAKISNASTVIQNPPGWNQGQGVALNRMFNMATGDPIIKLDADIKYHSGWISEARRLFNEHEEIGLLGLLHYYHDPVDSRKTVEYRKDEYSVHTHILGSAFAVRRSCWEELGPFEEHSEAFAEDWSFQRKVTESDKWSCALPKSDLVQNLGMGLETSTVVTAPGEVKTIHKSPFIIQGSSAAL